MKNYKLAAAGLLMLILSIAAAQPLDPTKEKGERRKEKGEIPDFSLIPSPLSLSVMDEFLSPPDEGMQQSAPMPLEPSLWERNPLLDILLPPPPPASLFDLAELPPQPMPGDLVDAPVPGASPRSEDAAIPRGRRRMPDLTIEQRRKMADLQIKFRKEIGPLTTDLAVKQVELNILWLDDEPNEDKVVAKAKEIEQVKARLQEKRLRNRIAMFKILTPEQRQQMPMRPRGMMQGRQRPQRAGPGLRQS